MKPKYEKFFHSWEIPEECWTDNPNGGYSSVLFPTKTEAKKAITLYKNLGRNITIADVNKYLPVKT